MNIDGFSLVEAMIAMFLISVAVTGGMTFYLQSQEVQARVVHKKIVTELANNKLEELKKAGFNNLPDPATPEILTVNIGGLSAQQTVTVTNVPPYGTTDYKQVEVVVNWTEPTEGGKAMVFNAVTYIAP